MQEMFGTNICLQTACTCGKSMDQQDILLLVEVYRTKDETVIQWFWKLGFQAKIGRMGTKLWPSPWQQCWAKVNRCYMLPEQKDKNKNVLKWKLSGKSIRSKWKNIKLMCQIPFLLLLAGGGEDIGPFFFLLRSLLTSSPAAAGRAMRWLTQVKGNWVHRRGCTVVSNPWNSKGNQQQMVLDRRSFIALHST